MNTSTAVELSPLAGAELLAVVADPVAELVAGTVPWFDASWFVPLLGVVEVVLGLSLIVGRRVTLVAAALAAHLSGTFLVLVMQPHVAFQHGNPILLTTEGEFVVKNLVLVSSALVLASRLGDPHLLTENSAVCPPRRSPNRGRRVSWRRHLST